MIAFRKFFNTTLANARVDPLAKEILMGHDIGLDKNYFRPTEVGLLQEYLKAVNDLTISEEFRLKQELLQFKEKQDEIDLMKLKHEKEMKAMNKKLNKIVSIIQQNPKAAYVKPEVLMEKMQQKLFDLCEVLFDKILKQLIDEITECYHILEMYHTTR